MKILYSETLTYTLGLVSNKSVNPYIFTFFTVSDTEFKELEVWLEETFDRKSMYTLTLNSVSFKNKDDAAYFKLAWMTND